MPNEVRRPRGHLTRYQGVFAPNFKHRHHIVPNRAHPAAREPHAPPPPMSWMHRLEHVFHIDTGVRKYCYCPDPAIPVSIVSMARPN